MARRLLVVAIVLAALFSSYFLFVKKGKEPKTQTTTVAIDGKVYQSSIPELNISFNYPKDPSWVISDSTQNIDAQNPYIILRNYPQAEGGPPGEEDVQIEIELLKTAFPVNTITELQEVLDKEIGSDGTYHREGNFYVDGVRQDSVKIFIKQKREIKQNNYAGIYREISFSNPANPIRREFYVLNNKGSVIKIEHTSGSYDASKEVFDMLISSLMLK